MKAQSDHTPTSVPTTALSRHSCETKDSKDFEDFIYLLSHDVRGSIRALLEVPHWIAEDLVADGHKITGQLADNINLMNTHTQRLDRMLIDLLVYSRVGRSQTKAVVYLQDALDTVLEQIKIPKGFIIESDFQCPAVMFGERDALTMISAVISNSLKHHHLDHGQIGISSRREGNDCVIRFIDDGPGIPEKYGKRVFEAMTTLKPRDEVEGSGMGLAIVRKIVIHHDGQLDCLSYNDAHGTILEMRFKQDAKMTT